MFRNRIITKSLAVFFILEILLNTVAPGISFALTDGPTAPEASSFEPVDTTEMVNLTSGDFVYNMPLLEVPGPSGGYPIALTYHAGINPTEEASWVGLGWNINPGSIVRSASGYPDDWKDVQSTITESWVGGKRTNVSFGLSASYMGFTFAGGITKTNDTYKGSATGGYTSLGYGLNMGNYGAGFSVGVSNNPINGSTLSIGGHVGYNASNVGLSLGVNHAFTMGGNSHSYSGGASVRWSTAPESSRSALGVSISSGGSTNASVAGIGLNSGHLDKSGHIKTQTSGMSKFEEAALSAASGIFSYSKHLTKYWIDETQTDWVNGALYPKPSEITQTYFNKHDYDLYDMFEVPDENEPPMEDMPSKVSLGNEVMLGGTLPATDNYAVMGQGTGGGIKPFDLVETLYRRNKKNADEKYISKQYTDALGALEENGALPEFMFINEFSNKFLYDNSGASEYFEAGSSPLEINTDASKIFTDPAFSGDRRANNTLGRASEVKWFSNKDILLNNGTDGLVLPNAPGFVRLNNDQIGAFRITNASGATYHYALPVYSYDEIYYTENIAQDVGKTGDYKTTVRRPEKYAYTWFLTAITGPDYVDRGTPGPSEDDWGYWIEFEYGKWSSDYKWRTPEAGFEEDLDGNFRNYSSGKKELYYLNAIRSATHTALFVKDLRKDGKGLARLDGEGSFQPVPCNGYPTSTLKLTKVILIGNEHLPSIDYAYNNSFGPISCTRVLHNPEDGTTVEEFEIGVHHGQNVLLTENITPMQLGILESNSIKRIVFDTDDTQMMPNTSNSFANEGIYTNEPVIPNQKFGKLELKGVTVFGRGTESLIPPIRFEYKNKTTQYNKDKIDFWGFYKSNYNSDIKDVNIRKMTNEESSLNVDTWSLNKIITSTGAEIQVDYESDDYGKAVLYNNVNFSISKLETLGDGQYKAYMEGIAGDLNSYFDVGQNVKSYVVISEAKKRTIKFIKTIAGLYSGHCTPVSYFKLQSLKPYLNNATIANIGSNYLVLNVNQTEEKVQHSLPYPVEITHSNITLPLSVQEVFATDCNPDQAGGLGQLCHPSEDDTYYYKDFIGGEIIAPIVGDKVGGGVRVKEIRIVEPSSGLTYSTAYDYVNPSTGNSSGVITYAPFKTNHFVLDYPEHYKNAVEGYFPGNDEYACSGGPLANLFKNWTDILSTLLFGPSTKSYLDNLSPIQLPDRKTMSAFLSLALSTKNDIAEFRRSQLMGALLSKVNEAPSPNVMYEFVTVKNKVIRDGVSHSNPSYVVNQYIVYDESMVDIETSHSKTTDRFNGDPDPGQFRDLKKRGITINNFGSAVGQLKSSRVYTESNILLSESVNHYLHELSNGTSDMLDNYLNKLAPYASQGVIDETYVNARYVPYDKDYVDEVDDGETVEKEVYQHDLVGVVTKRRNLPIVLIETENKDYKSGLITVSKNLAFDFYSGVATKSISTDGYGNTYMSEMTPAYKMYPTMGVRMNGGDNMLTQEAASYTYKVDALNTESKLGLVGASIQTWSDQSGVLDVAGGQSGIWRKKASYSWMGNDQSLNTDGLYPISNFLPFNFNTGAVNSTQWQKNSNITLYDVNSHALEATDVNNLYAATKFSIDNARVFSTVANASYNQYAFSGAEDITNDNLMGGGVLKLQGEEVTAASEEDKTTTHTGLTALQVDNGEQTFKYTNTYIQDKKHFLASVWTNNSNGKIRYKANGVLSESKGSTNNNKKAGGWYLIELNIPVTGVTNLEVWCEAEGGTSTFDDFRIYPHDAAMTSCVYNKWGELSHILDNNNLYTEYRYDGMGRLKETYRESFQYGTKMTAKTEYHYASPTN